MQAGAKVAFAPQIVNHRRRVKGNVAGCPFRPDMVGEITSRLRGRFGIIAQGRLPIADDIRPEAKIYLTRAQISSESEIRKDFRASKVINQRFIQARVLPFLKVVGQFDVEAALRRHLVRQVTDKLAATTSN
jgi:hypothetical protein